MNRVLIIEDEGVAARRLEKMLGKFKLEVVGICPSNTSLVSHINTAGEPDLYLMDIHLNDGLVFDTLNKLTLKSPIIFTTAFDQYAIKAFKQNSIDYLLKPIDAEELKNAIHKFESKQQASSIDLNALSKLMQANSEKAVYKERISVKIGERIKSIQLSAVHGFVSEQKATFLLSHDGRHYPIDYPLDQLESVINPAHFFRTSRGVIVNINAIKDIIAYSGSRLKIVLENHESREILVARERVKSFKTWLG